MYSTRAVILFDVASRGSGENFKFKLPHSLAGCHSASDRLALPLAVTGTAVGSLIRLMSVESSFFPLWTFTADSELQVRSNHDIPHELDYASIISVILLLRSSTCFAGGC